MTKTTHTAAFLLGLGLGTTGMYRATRPDVPFAPHPVALTAPISKALQARDVDARRVTGCATRPARDAQGNYKQTACALAGGGEVAFDRGEL